MQHFKGGIATSGTADRGSIGRIVLGSKEEVQGMGVEVVAKQAALEARKHIAVPSWTGLAPGDSQASEMLDEHSTCKTVFAGFGAVCPNVARNAHVGLFLKPEEVEDASPLLQLFEKGLNGMDGVQELKAV